MAIYSTESTFCLDGVYRLQQISTNIKEEILQLIIAKLANFLTRQGNFKSLSKGLTIKNKFYCKISSVHFYRCYPLIK